jgi:hypothetical protein
MISSKISDETFPMSGIFAFIKNSSVDTNKKTVYPGKTVLNESEEVIRRPFSSAGIIRFRFQGYFLRGSHPHPQRLIKNL